jgi:Ca2+:H+ antiporter
MTSKWLLIFVPIGIALAWLKLSPALVFFASALSVIPLANLMGDATEELSASMGSAKGGLLNATMGTVPDIIIGFFALKHGLVDMVKASITGAILGNLLLGLGLAILLGGLRVEKALGYDMKATHQYGGLLLLATFGLIIPAVFDYSAHANEEISLEISLVLFLTYIVSVLFTLTDRMTDTDYPRLPIAVNHEHDKTHTKSINPLFQLALVMIGLAVMSEVMTDSIGPAAESFGFTPLFAGIFLLAPVGMASEMINAVRFARKNQLDISLAITQGSSTQMVLLVAPLLVFLGLAMGKEMNLLFSKFEVIAIIFSVAAANNILNLGTVRWVSGPKLIAIYIMLGFGFYYAPLPA